MVRGRILQQRFEAGFLCRVALHFRPAQRLRRALLVARVIVQDSLIVMRRLGALVGEVVRARQQVARVRPEDRIGELAGSRGDPRT